MWKIRRWQYDPAIPDVMRFRAHALSRPSGGYAVYAQLSQCHIGIGFRTYAHMFPCMWHLMRNTIRARYGDITLALTEGAGDHHVGVVLSFLIDVATRFG